MDSYYDLDGAAKRLETLALDRGNSPHSGLQLSQVVSATTTYEATLSGRNWKLAHKAPNGSGCSEEVVAMFQGIICKKDLPPFTEKLGGNTSTQARYLRQSVTITGLKTATFDKVVDAVADVHTLLSRAVGIDNIQNCTMISSYHGATTLELSNRYFTRREAGNAGEHSGDVALTDDIDPYGILAKAATASNLYHSEDNTVAYFEREGTCDRDYKYKEAKPIIFGIGDIMEIHASFTTFPLKDNKAKTAMVLRGVTLLDGNFAQERARKIVKAVPLQIPKKLKRRIGYTDEQLSSTRASMTEMDIDNGEESERREKQKVFRGDKKGRGDLSYQKDENTSGDLD